MKLAVFDNGGESLDRYTVIYIGKDYRISHPYRSYLYPYLAMSDRPFHPQGFGQHGEIEIFPNDMRQLRKGKGQKLFSYLGKRINFNDLPEDCQKLVNIDLAMDSLSQLEATF